MFSEFSGSFADLTPEQRSELSELLRVRNAFTRKTLAINELKIQVLANPTPEAEEMLRVQAQAVAKDRLAVKDQLQKVLSLTVDTNGLKSILPMLLVALAQYINVPLLLNAAGIEPDVIEDFIGQTKKYFKSNLD